MGRCQAQAWHRQAPLMSCPSLQLLWSLPKLCHLCGGISLYLPAALAGRDTEMSHLTQILPYPLLSRQTPLLPLWGWGCCCRFSMLGIKPRVFLLLDKCSCAELYPKSHFKISNYLYLFWGNTWADQRAHCRNQFFHRLAWCQGGLASGSLAWWQAPLSSPHDCFERWSH